MGTQNTAKHLAYLKSQVGKLGNSEEPSAFFLVYDRSTREALLHVDSKAAPPQFKNPKVIQQRIAKAKALDPAAYDEFFEGKKLVSVAGPVHLDADGETVVFGLAVGKAGAGDMKAALKGFKFIKSYRLDESSEEPEAEDEAPEAAQAPPADPPLQGRAAALAAAGPVTAQAVQDSLYDKLGGVDGLLETIGEVEQALSGASSEERKKELEEMRAALVEARDALKEWGDPEQGGALGLAAGLAELLSQSQLDEAAADLIADALAEVRAGWAEAMAEARADLATLAGAVEAAAAELEEDQDPEGLRALSDVEALVELVLAEVPEEVRAVLEDDAAKIAVNAKMIDAVRVSLAVLAAQLPASPVVAMTDATLGAGLGARLGEALGRGEARLQSLQRHLGSIG